ncbi:MAG: EamA family transporter [Desulfobulbaceae bacterium]|nr:EamA family transporter [Desulfobulbaceae bacterium]
MKNFIFYLSTILIWGSTWIGIKLQLGVVDPMVSVGLRFALAAILLLLWCRLKNLNLKFSRNDHLYIGLQGTFLFCLNYLLFYLAELQLTSGLAAVVFSTILLMNVINGRIFLGNPLDMRVIVGGILGLSGIVLVFKSEITSFSLDSQTFKAVLFCILATYLASIGNILSARNQNHKLPIVQTNGLGMAYGALLMLGTALVTGKDFTIEPTLIYLGSLCYLAVFGSIIAFGCYLALVGNIGPDRAAYATLLFPIVALIISTIWEDYRWTQAAIGGVVLILCGNLLMLKREKKQPHTIVQNKCLNRAESAI